MASNNKLKLKLLIEKKSQKVLFAETGKDVVDFLFSLLAMPIGTVIKLITKESMTGCLGATYGSLEQLDNTFLLSNQTKSHLLNPTTSTAVSTNSLLLSASDDASSGGKINKYYTCPGNGSSLEFHNCVTDAYGAACLVCLKGMIKQVEFVARPTVNREEDKGERGFVKGVVTYTVMDDLSVMPMSTISSITLFNRFGIKDLSTLQEKTVGLGLPEGLELLKASLQSNNVLTDVFLTKEEVRA
ncbi:uncharacterized protein LOC144575287 [Carex rostrata]